MNESKDSDPTGYGDNNPQPIEIRIDDKPKQKSKKRKWLVAMMVLFFVSTAIFIALFVYYYKMPGNARGVAQAAREICNTPNCVVTASTFAKFMNFTADPCEDFSEFACGRFFKEIKLKEGVFLVGPIESLNEASKETVSEIVTEMIAPTDPQYLVKVKTFYKSCLDLDAIEKVGVGPILNYTDFISDWPTLNPAWNDSDFDFNEVLVRFSVLLVNPLFTFRKYATYGDFSKGRLQINAPELDLDHRFFLQPGPQTAALQTYLTDLAVALGAEANVSSQDAKDVIDFQRKQAKVYLTSLELASGGKFNTTTLSKIGEIYPNIDVAGSLRSTFSVAGISLPDDLKLILYPSEYLVMMSKLINETSPRTLQNVFAFKYAKDRLDDASKHLREIRVKFNKAIAPNYQVTSRTQMCLQLAAVVFMTGISKQFVDRTFTAEAKHYVEDMVDDMKDAFRHMLVESTWMSNTTKQEALRKLEKMTTYIGYPDAYEYDNYVDAFYENYTMAEDAYYDNSILIIKLRFIQEMKEMLTDYETEDDVSTANAFYNAFFNKIDVYAGILQPPVFSLIFPDYYNYAAIGSIIGHEIIHGFDRKGSLLNADGYPINWWDDDDRAEYLNKTQCFIDQFSGFYIEEVNMTINGTQTIGETLADVVGLKMSFRAYEEEVKRTGRQLILPGLDLTQDQLFFLSYGRIWCAKESPVFAKYLVLRDNHPPAKFRMIGSLQNSEEFAKAYNCPRGSYMNPEVKCNMW